MKGWLLKKFQKFIGFEKVREVQIKGSVVEDLCEMAASAYPKEMLAFISATKGVRNGLLVIDEIQLQAYHASVTSASANLWQLPTHTSIIGTVHSHPSGHNHPSRADLHLFGQYGLVHAIIGKPYTKDTIRWMDKNGDEIVVRVSS